MLGQSSVIFGRIHFNIGQSWAICGPKWKARLAQLVESPPSRHLTPPIRVSKRSRRRRGTRHGEVGRLSHRIIFPRSPSRHPGSRSEIGLSISYRIPPSLPPSHPRDIQVMAVASPSSVYPSGGDPSQRPPTWLRPLLRLPSRCAAKPREDPFSRVSTIGIPPTDPSIWRNKFMLIWEYDL